MNNIAINELQRTLTMASKRLNRIQVAMRKTKNQEQWLELANLHADITLNMHQVREAMNEIRSR